MHFSKLCQFVTIVLSACSVLETSGSSIRSDLNNGPVSARPSEDDAEHTDRHNTDTFSQPVPGWWDLADKVINSPDIAHVKALDDKFVRRPRSAQRQQTGTGEEAESDSEAKVATHNQDMQMDDSSVEGDSFPTQPAKVKHVSLYKDPNRTRKVMSSNSRPMKNADPSLGSEYKRTDSLSSEDDHSETENDADGERDHTQSDLTENTRSQNRPSWLNPRLVDPESHDPDLEREEVNESAGSSVNVTPYQNRENSSTGVVETESGSETGQLRSHLETRTKTSSDETSSSSRAKRRKIRVNTSRNDRHYRHYKSKLREATAKRNEKAIGTNEQSIQPPDQREAEFSNDYDEEVEEKKDDDEDKHCGCKADKEKTAEEEEEAEIDEEEDDLTTDCPNCGQDEMTEEGVRYLRLGMFANIMAQKLRINITEQWDENKKIRMPILPNSVMEQTLKDIGQEESKQEFLATDQEIIIQGEEMDECIRRHATGCYSFHLEGRITGQVASALLWIYKMNDKNDIGGQTFNGYELERVRSGELKRRNLIVRKDITIEADWVALNLTMAVQRWVDKKKPKEMVAISCKTCYTKNHKSLFGVKHGYKPILVITYATPNLLSREKRSEPECDPRIECCKRPLQVNFSRLSMSILYPDNQTVGYCYGHCNDVDQSTYNHTAIMQRLRWESTIDPLIKEQLKPCCVPIILKDLFVLAIERDYMVRKIVPKVIVERCGCV